MALLLWWRQNTWHRSNSRAVLSYPELSWPSMQMSSVPGCSARRASAAPAQRRAAATCQLDRGERAVHISRTVTRAVKDVRA